MDYYRQMLVESGMIIRGNVIWTSVTDTNYHTYLGDETLVTVKRSIGDCTLEECKKIFTAAWENATHKVAAVIMIPIGEGCSTVDTIEYIRQIQWEQFEKIPFAETRKLVVLGEVVHRNHPAEEGMFYTLTERMEEHNDVIKQHGFRIFVGFDEADIHQKVSEYKTNYSLNADKETE